MQELKGVKREGSTSENAEQEVAEQQLSDARRAARAAADALLLTDAPLLFPPGQLGLAAMRSGFNKVTDLSLCPCCCITHASCCSSHALMRAHASKSCKGGFFAAAMHAVTCQVGIRNYPKNNTCMWQGYA